MIVAPDILSKIEGQPFSADSPFGCQTPLEITPEALQAVDVAPLPIAERLAVVHKPVDVAPRCDARVAGKGVRADDGATLHALVQERQQRLGFHVRYHLRPHQATSTQDPKDSLLSGSTAPLRALNTLCQAPVAPGTSQVGLVDLHHAGEDMGNVPDHGLAHHDQGSQDSLSLQAGLLGNHLGTLPQDEPAQQSPPLPWRQPKRQRPGHPLVVAGCTTTLTSPNAPALGVLTSRAPNLPSHATILSQVAVLGLYPKVINLSLPYQERGEKPWIEFMEEIFGGDFYFVHFNRQPGIADAVLEENTFQFLRNMYRENQPPTEPEPGMAMINLARAETPLGEPIMTDSELAVFVSAFESTGFTSSINWYRNLDRNWHLLADVNPIIQQPTLMIYGDRDAVRRSENLTEFVPNVEVVSLDCGHWIQQEKPEETNQAILKWLDQQGAT